MTSRVVVLGANGQLGTDLMRVLAQRPGVEARGLTRANLDITDRDSVAAVLDALRPTVVINTTAYHQVDEVEDHADRAFAVNAVAQQTLADYCAARDCAIVYCSTDYVYGLDAARQRPYTEGEAPGPVNAYGVSKVAGEQFTRYLAPRHFVVRVSGLHGVAGSAGKGGNFVELMLRLGRERGEVSVVNDQILTPTYTRNLATNLADLIATDAYGLYHMTAEGQCSWWEFASAIFAEAGLTVRCNPVASSHFPTRARRPGYAALENAALNDAGLNRMRDWRQNLIAYLVEKGHRDRA
jgi:dTDP-4-dehydrorhamnose reductase